MHRGCHMGERSCCYPYNGCNSKLQVKLLRACELQIYSVIDCHAPLGMLHAILWLQMHHMASLASILPCMHQLCQAQPCCAHMCLFEPQ